MGLNMKSMIRRKQTYKGEAEAKEEKSDILIFNYCEKKTHTNRNRLVLVCLHGEKFHKPERISTIGYCSAIAVSLFESLRQLHKPYAYCRRNRHTHTHTPLCVLVHRSLINPKHMHVSAAEHHYSYYDVVFCLAFPIERIR